MNRLAKKKKYYVRVRGYVTNNGKNYYGAWSKVKTIHTENKNSIGLALEMYPLALATHIADMESTFYIEGGKV